MTYRLQSNLKIGRDAGLAPAPATMIHGRASDMLKAVIEVPHAWRAWHDHNANWRDDPVAAIRDHGEYWSRRFYGESWAVMENRLIHGWPEGAGEVRKLAARLRVHDPLNVRRRPAWRSEGNDLNIDRALRGDWDIAWRGVERAPGLDTNVLRIIVAGAYDCDVLPEQGRWNGVAALALTDVLEQAGWNIELLSVYMGESTEHPNQQSGVVLTVKEAGEPCNLTLLAGILGHITFYRRVLIPLCNMGEPFNGWLDGGKPVAMSPAQVDRLRAAGVIDDIPALVIEEPATSEVQALKIASDAVDKINNRVSALLER